MSIDSLIGREIGGYEIMKLLGRGGMAEVYLARQKSNDRLVAIKLLYPYLTDDQKFVDRFIREARTMSAISTHPYIVDVYDFDFVADRHYIVMEYVSGGSLKDLIGEYRSAGGVMPLGQACKIFLQITDALTYAHTNGLLHRDIKPANILLNETLDGILTDFGIAKIAHGTTYTATGAMVGTPQFMAPEKVMGKPDDARCDIYSLGVLFYNMVTSQIPFDADTPVAVLFQHLNTEARPPSQINHRLPRNIEVVINKAMMKEPNERFQSAYEMGETLRQGLKAAEDQTLFLTLPAALRVTQPKPIHDPSIRRSISPKSDEQARLKFDHDDTLADLVLDKVDRPTLHDLEMSGSQTGTPAGGNGSAGVGDDAGRTVRSPALPQSMRRGPAIETLPAHQPIVADSGRSQRPRLFFQWGMGLILVSLLIGGGFAFQSGRLNTLFVPPTPIRIAAPIEIAEEETATPPAPTEIAAIRTESPAQSATPLPPTATQTPAATATGLPTETLVPTATAVATETSTPEPTIDPTVQFLKNCNRDLSVEEIYTYSDPSSQLFAPIGANLRLNFVLFNSGTCPWSAETELAHFEQTGFGFSEPVSLGRVVNAGERITVIVDDLQAPNRAGDATSVWRLVNEEGNMIGTPIQFELRAYSPSTATPTPAPATPTPNRPLDAPTPLPGGGANEPLGLLHEFSNCEYVGNDLEYRCDLKLTPYGGAPGEVYTVLVTDADNPTRHYGSGPFLHLAKARRCAQYIHEVIIQGDISQDRISVNIYFNPNVEPLFPGGGVCQTK